MHTHTPTPTPPLILLCSSHLQLTQLQSFFTYSCREVEESCLLQLMATCGFLSLQRVMLLLVVFIGDVVTMAMARTLLGGIAEAPLPAVAAEGPGVGARPSGRRQDRSIAGADVILVGFAAAVVAVIFLYIRVTRKSNHGADEMAEKA